MARVGRARDFGLGAGRLQPLAVPQRREDVSPTAFGYGRSVESFGGGAGPEAYGAGRNVESFGGGRTPGAFGAPDPNIAANFERTIQQGLGVYAAVQRRNEILDANATSLKLRRQATEDLIGRQNQIEEGQDPGDFAKAVSTDYDAWAAKQVEGLSGLKRQIVEADLQQVGASVFERAASFEGQRRRQHVELQQRTVYNEALGQADSARNAVFTNPADLGHVLQGQLATIAATALPDDLKEKLARTVTGALTEAHWRGQLEKDPYGVRTALSQGDVPGLEYDDRLRVLSAANSEITQRENEARRQREHAEVLARQAAAQARQELQFTARGMIQDEEAAAANGERVNPNYEKVARAAFGSQAEPIIARINHLRETGNLAQRFATMPTSDIQGVLEGRRPAGDGYAYEAKDLAMLRQAADRVVTQRLEHPAESVLATVPAIADALNSDDADRIGKALTESARVQGETFGLPQDSIRPMPKDMVQRVVDRFTNAATSKERLDVLQKAVGGIGNEALADRVLGQLEEAHLPAQARFALEALREGRTEDAKKILAGVTTKPEELPKLSSDKESAAAQSVDEALATPGRPASLTTFAAGLSQQPGLYRRQAAERDTLLRMTKQFMSAGDDAATAAAKAEGAVFGSRPVAGDGSLGFVRVPEGYDPGVLTDGMREARATVDLSHLDPVKLGLTGGAAPGETNLIGRNMAAWQESVRNGGLFVETDGGYALLSPGGEAVPDPANPSRPLVFTPDQLLKAAVRKGIADAQRAAAGAGTYTGPTP